MSQSSLALSRVTSRRNLLGDLRGGLTAAFVGIPAELVYGLIAFAPLGAELQARGVVACFYACIIAAVATTIAGGHAGQIPGSRPALALIVAALIAELLERWPGWFGGPPQALDVLNVMFATVVLAGLLQIGFGLLRLGQLVKYLPAPVLSGITNGVAILIVAQIVRPLFGVPAGVAVADPAAWLDAVKPLNLLPGLVAALLFVRPPRRLAGVPPIMIGLTASIVVYYVVVVAAGPARLGPTFGALPSALPAFAGFELFAGRHAEQWPEVFRAILPYALTIAALASVESLLSAAAVDSICQTQHRSNRELVAQGIGNIGAGLFGATPVAATMPRTLVSIHAGARSGRACLAYAVILAGAILFAPGVLGAVPQVATAGILLGVAWQMIDPWSRKTLRRMFLERPARPDAGWRSVAANGLVMLAVALSTLLFGLVWALALGILLTTLFFLHGNQKTVIRAVMSGRERRSLRVRTHEQAEFLAALAGDIVIIEVQGPLFFGSADKLAAEIEGRAPDGDCFVIDLARVGYIDATAARVLDRARQRLLAAGKKLYVSGLDPLDPLRREIFAALNDAGFAAAQWFGDLDGALEAVEDEILAIRFDPEDRWRPHALGETSLARDLDPAEVEILRSYLCEREFPAREVIYRESEPGDRLFVLVSGAVSLYLSLGSGQQTRVGTFAAGTVFGSLAFLGGTSCSDNAVADVEVVALELSAASLGRLTAEHPALAAKILRNLGASLAQRLGDALECVRATRSN